MFPHTISIQAATSLAKKQPTKQLHNQLKQETTEYRSFLGRHNRTNGFQIGKSHKSEMSEVWQIQTPK